jgi:tetratricopeptide (TPR) repeat protein
MPSHTYAHLGRYTEAVRANVLALQAEQRYRERAQAQGFKPEDNWVYHNQHFLWFAALMLGQGDMALSAARGNVRSFGEGDDPYLEYVRSLPIFTLARLERWEEVLQEPAPTGKAVAPAMHRGARGVALARLGRLAEAKTELASLQEASGRLRGIRIGPASGGQDMARGAVEVSLARLQAEIAAAEGRWEEAEAHQRRAIQAAAPFDRAEPAMYGAGMRVALGELLLRAGKPKEAAAVFQEELTERPQSGWALRGQMQVALAQGEAQEAARHAREFDRVWATADGRLRVPR